MNEAMCLAEDNGIQMYYQDTDSLHLKACDVSLLSKLFKEKYERELTGKRLGQFHSDFVSMDGTESFAVKSIFCAKKIYIDKLSNDNSLISFHTRLKGIKPDVIGITANKLYPRLIPVELRNGLYYPMYEEFKNKCSVEQLYEDLFAGKSIEFDLCESASPCFDMRSNFSIETKSSFIRRIKC
jgi:hypothetical protein